jgi:hypothetical protein
VRTEETIVGRHEVIVISAAATSAMSANQISVLRTRIEDAIASPARNVDAEDLSC